MLEAGGVVVADMEAAVAEEPAGVDVSAAGGVVGGYFGVGQDGLGGGGGHDLLCCHGLEVL